ncbi:MAG: multidrug DMT transporter permease [Caldithrix sp.]|nr:MAG: multidrug DMT transporter permease [Caldithrix sp.]
MQDRELIKAYFAWAAVSIFWGTTYLAIRIGVEVLPPALFAGIRFLIAGLILIPILLLKGYSLPSKKDLIPISITGILLLTVANGTVVWSEQWVSSSLAALIIASIPFFMVGMEALMPNGEKLSLKKGLGILVGFCGIFLLLWPDIKGAINSAYLKGIMGLVIAIIAWAAGSIYSKHRDIKTAPFMSAAFQMLIAGGVLTLIGMVKGELSQFTFDPKGIAALVYLMIFGSLIGYSAYIYALAKLPTATVSTYAYINPVIAVILGWLVLDERLDWIVALATVIILSGVLLVKKEAEKFKTGSSDAMNEVKKKDDLILETS